ncbi:MAG TPA: DUF2752 domain-containing protein [Blastocatellia bacterium]
MKRRRGYVSQRCVSGIKVEAKIPGPYPAPSIHSSNYGDVSGTLTSVEDVITTTVESPEGSAHARRTAFAVVGGLAVVFAFSIVYNAPGGNYFTVCGFKNLTGLPCPGCGLAHSFCALAKGRVIQAFDYNALGPVVFLLLIVVWVRHALILLNKENIAARFDSLMTRVKLGWVLVIAFSVYGIGRIVYLLAAQPSILHDGYIGQLLSRL